MTKNSGADFHFPRANSAVHWLLTVERVPNAQAVAMGSVDVAIKVFSLLPKCRQMATTVQRPTAATDHTNTQKAFSPISSLFITFLLFNHVLGFTDEVNEVFVRNQS